MVAIFALYIFGFRLGFVIADGRIEWEFRPIRTNADEEDLDFYTRPEAAAEGWVLDAPEFVAVDFSAAFNHSDEEVRI